MPRNSLLFSLFSAFALALAAPVTHAEQGAILKPVDAKVNSPREALRTQIFGAEAAQPGCKTVAADVDQDLSLFIKKVVDAVKRKDDKALQPLFHTHLNTSLTAINDTFGRMDLIYGKGQDVSVYRLFALNSVDGAPVGVACDGGQERAFALYGYPLQFGLWLQLQGPKELGRAFIHIVPADGHWTIGSFHLHQWTHGEKDAEAWANEGLKASGAGHKGSAFVFYDIAAKLLDAGNHLELPARNDLLKARDAQYTPDAWDKMLKAVLNAYKVSYTASMLVPDTGTAALLVRQTVDGEVSVEHIENTCAAMALTVAATNWAKDLSGIRCGFNLPRESPKDEGLLGSIYMTFEDAQKHTEKLAKAKKQ